MSQLPGIRKFQITVVLFMCLFAHIAISADDQDSYIGGEACADCHQDIYQRWSGSHHDLAMQEANSESVLGDFDNQTFSYYNVTSRFTKDEQRFFVETDGPDGKLAKYEIAYVFGVYPLQQYLIELKQGSYQSLGIAWDARKQEQGGQRWFHLYPDQEVKHDEPLHWTGLDQNWNYMCAECHSTNLNKHFNSDAEAYETTWSDINVSCEACHGPGKQHVDWAENNKDAELHGSNYGLQISLENSAKWNMHLETGIAVRSPARNENIEVEVCARCHSRRSAQWQDYQHGRPLLDTHIPATLSEQLYHPDGQIDDEVYVYGSFIQSKMFQKGVTCADCHDAHTSKLKAEGNQLCGTCHLAAKFDTPDHHFHETGKSGSECVSCHMPEKNFMVIDGRRDHSFRIPRPDLSLKLATPNACVQCHQDKSDNWAAENIEQWYPDSHRRVNMHYGEVLFAGQQGSAEANQLLIDLANDLSKPGIVRASAVSQLQGYMNPFTLTAVNDQLHDKNALVRFSAIGVTEPLPPSTKVKLLKHLLDDDLRMIRLEAARELANSRAQITDKTLLEKLDYSISEYIAAQTINAERPEAHVNLGVLYANMQRIDDALSEYKKAIAIDPTFISAYINVADLYRAQNLDAKGKDYLLAAIDQRPDIGVAHHALGLLFIRERNMDSALSSLLKATQVEPANTRYQYVYAVALDSIGESEKAISVLIHAHNNRPSDREVLYALVSLNQRAGDIRQAKHFANILVEVAPWDRDARALLERL